MNNGHSFENKTILESIRVQNYRSLRDVKLFLKPLTIIVGPNASGKSNCLAALKLVNTMISSSELPPRGFIKYVHWAENDDPIEFELTANCHKRTTQYSLSLGWARSQTPFQQEILTIQNTTVISVARGKGLVYNDDGTNSLPYQGTDLALKSAGSYGSRPITNTFADFIRGWQFYDVNPEDIREYSSAPPTFFRISDGLDTKGRALSALISHWASRDPDFLALVNETMKVCGGAELEITKSRDKHIRMLEGLSKPLSLDSASDGTLRLLAYNVLLHQPNPPTLIGVEEPERNLHPAVLTQVSRILEQLAQRTQVVITTHSSQLLDCFTPDSLSKNLAILLLRKKAESGTEAISLEEIRSDHEALQDWMTDFGIGNAIFQSQLLQDIMGC
jgi:predicted ATPase